MLRVTLLLIAVGDTQGGNTDQAAKEKAVRLKTVRQLKEILTELGLPLGRSLKLLKMLKHRGGLCALQSGEL